MPKQSKMRKHDYNGKLIVIEGTDASGKSTQIELLKKYLECQGYGVLVSEWKSSELIANVIDDAKERNLFNANTFSLMYAADFDYRLPVELEDLTKKDINGMFPEEIFIKTNTQTFCRECRELS